MRKGWDKDMEQEKLYVIEEKTYEAHIDEEVHLYGLLHQLALNGILQNARFQLFRCHSITPPGSRASSSASTLSISALRVVRLS